MKSRYKILVIGSPVNSGYSSLGLHQSHNGGGWIESFINNKKIIELFDIVFCFFANVNNVLYSQGNPAYYCIPDYDYSSSKVPLSQQKYLTKIVKDEKPDLIHVFGTERPTGLFLLNKYGCNRVLISITGLVSEIGDRYYAGLSKKDISKNMTFGDIIRHRGIKIQKENFVRRGKTEIEIIKAAKYISGRTNWDKDVIQGINSNVEYRFCNETLRDGFYNNMGTWNYDKCQKHSLFIAAGNYPIKGLHVVLEALTLVKKNFVDVKLYISGNDIIKSDTLKSKIALSNYGKIIKNKIKNNHLENNVSFVGNINENKMIEMYKKANVFIMSSCIENSSNSLGEAMLIGTPVVSTTCCGLGTIVENNANAICYEWDDSKKMAESIERLFTDTDMCLKLSKNAQVKSQTFFSKESMILNIINIYNEIIQNKQ